MHYFHSPPLQIQIHVVCGWPFVLCVCIWLYKYYIKGNNADAIASEESMWVKMIDCESTLPGWPLRRLDIKEMYSIYSELLQLL